MVTSSTLQHLPTHALSVSCQLSVAFHAILPLFATNARLVDMFPVLVLAAYVLATAALATHPHSV